MNSLPLFDTCVTFCKEITFAHVWDYGNLIVNKEIFNKLTGRPMTMGFWLTLQYTSTSPTPLTFFIDPTTPPPYYTTLIRTLRPPWPAPHICVSSPPCWGRRGPPYQAATNTKQGRGIS